MRRTGARTQIGSRRGRQTIVLRSCPVGNTPRLTNHIQPGEIATIAGNGSAGYSGDGGPGTSAKINGPTGLILDSAGDVFFAEINNSVSRKVFGP